MSIIIEHPTRGTLREWDGIGEDRSFRFSWSGSRNDPDKAHQFDSVSEAVALLDTMPTPLRSQSKVLYRRPGGIAYEEAGASGEEIAFDPDAKTLPDRNGKPVRVGDYIQDRDGDVWRVTAFAAREAYDNGIVTRRNGLLDRQYSAFRVERPCRLSGRELDMLMANLEPMTETSVSLPDAVLVDSPGIAKAFERVSISNVWLMIDHWEGRLAAKRSEVARREAAL